MKSRIQIVGMLAASGLVLVLTSCAPEQRPAENPPAPVTRTASPPLRTTSLPLSVQGAKPLAYHAQALANNQLEAFETPDDGKTTVLSSIKGASHSIEIEIYDLDDPDVLNALETAQKNGVQVRVILNHYKYNYDVHPPKREIANAPALAQLKAAGVGVEYSSNAYRFTHAKTILADVGYPDAKVLIMNLNLSPGYMGEPPKLSLNFSVVDKKDADMSYVHDMFEHDWADQAFSRTDDGDLVISPIDSRDKLIDQIKSAKHSIHFFAQELSDKQIIQALADAAQSGVEVRGLVSPIVKKDNIQPIEDAGGSILLWTKIYQHAKATIMDDESVYIGSINYTKGSMDQNREAGIITDAPNVVSLVNSKFDAFWKDGQPVTQ